MKIKKRTLAIIVIILLVLAALWFLRGQTTDGLAQVSPQATSSLVELAGEDAFGDETTALPQQSSASEDETAPDENGAYTTKDEIAAYLVAYGRLPQNFSTKSEARALGWSGGGLDDFDYGKCIGGDRFGNNEGLLPEANGRKYYECDIDTLHADDRGPKRIVFSNDGLIYYSGDHYDSFELLYGEP